MSHLPTRKVVPIEDGDASSPWLTTRFSHVLDAIKDGTHGTFERVANGLPLLSAKNVEDGRLCLSADESLVSVEDHSAIVANGFPRRGDLLLTIVGTIGRACVFERSEPIAFQRSVCFLRLRNGLVPRYFYYFSQSADFQAQLSQNAKSSAQAGVYMSDVAALTVSFPKSRAEQLAIVAFLDRETSKISALIAEQEKLIALLKEKRQALVSHAVTKGLDPNTPMKDSGIEWLGQVPAHWNVARLSTIFREVSDIGADDLPILSVSIHDGISDKELDEAEMDRKVTRSEDRSKYKAVLPGDLAYNMMRAWQGGFGAVTVAGQVSPAYVVARPIGKVCTAFIEQLLRTPQAVEQMRRHSRGVTDFRLRLYWEEFKTLRVVLPTLPEQQAIMDAIAIETTKFDSLVGESVGAIELLKERRAALISAAVTGKIDLRLV